MLDVGNPLHHATLLHLAQRAEVEVPAAGTVGSLITQLVRLSALCHRECVERHGVCGRHNLLHQVVRG
jgi:hypothetical protein